MMRKNQDIQLNEPLGSNTIGSSQVKPIPTRRMAEETEVVKKEVQKEIRGKRRVKLSPPRNESVTKEISIFELEDESAKPTMETNLDDKIILGTGRKIAQLEEPIFPDVLTLPDEKIKARLTTMLEQKTFEMIQVLKETKKIKSISGLIEAAVNEFIEKYHLRD